MTRIPTRPVQQRQPVFRDPAYLKSANGRPCDVCGSVGTTVFCHDRRDQSGGMGMKPDDRLGFFGCENCHREQEANHETTRVWESLARKLTVMEGNPRILISAIDRDIEIQRALMRERHEKWRLGQ